MRPSMLLAPLLAGCLNLAAAVEAHDRPGQHARQMGSFRHPAFAHAPSVASSGHRFGHPRHVLSFAQPRHALSFGQPRHVLSFGRPHRVLRFKPDVPGLSRVPGHRILAGRRILPFVHGPRLRLPSLVHVLPAHSLRRHGSSPRHPHALIIIVRDPWRGGSPWQMWQ